MKKIFQYIKPHIPIMSLQIFIKFGGTIVELLLPWMLSIILDEVAPTGNIPRVYIWGGLMIICSALALVGNIVANRMATRISSKITKNIRHELFEKISYLSNHQTDEFTIPSLISRLTTDTYNVHQMIDRMQRLGVRAPILLLGGIIVTMMLDPILTLVLIGTLPLLAIVIVYVSQKGIPLYTKMQASLDSLIRKVQENMAGIRIIKSLSKSDYEKKQFDTTNLDMSEKEQTAGILMAVTNPAMNLFLNIGLALVIIVGAYRVNSGVILPGKIIAFLSYFAIILNALMMVTRLFVMYSKGAASAKRIEEVFSASQDIKTEQSDYKESEFHIEFDNVNFSYNKVQNNVTGISFGIKQGETLGIIGPTGCGKTTIISLLLRFYDVDSGAIRINGEKINSISSEILHTKFGVVFQNDFIFADSMRENIDFGRFLRNEQIDKAVKTAQADFIEQKENKLDEMLSVKGSNLSGGQKQRLLIARALAANPEILLLDDCSSALDYKTDAALRHALASDFCKTTTIIVAQRISSIMGADKIIVMDDGSAIGYGTHEELLGSCGSYKEIYNIQMGEV